MSKKETAEQKLLRIIEEGAKTSGETTVAAVSSASASNIAHQTAAAVRGPALGVPSVTESLAGIFKKVQEILPTGKSFGLREVNLLVIFLIVILIISLIMISKSEMKRLQEGIQLTDSASEIRTRLIGSIMPQYEDAQQFLSTILTRNIFRPYEKTESAATPLVLTGRERISVKIEKLKLVGISWLDEPNSTSVMVEQSETGMTYFLKQGESFDGLTVKAIYNDRVIFSYQNEEMEVRL